MLVPPKRWNNRKYFGAYFTLNGQAPIMKHILTTQSEVVRNAVMPSVLQGLDYLGSIPWRVNKKVFDVICEAWERGLTIGEIPPKNSYEIPEYEDFKREKLNDEKFLAEIRETYAINPDISQTKPSSAGFIEFAPTENTSNVLPYEDFQERIIQRSYRSLKARLDKKNRELHSLRCDMRIKINIADEFKDDIIYFPHQLDFRGRAYPISPNLSHMGSDFCRALLTFSEKKPLGENGFKWLKIHLANLFGNNKVTFEERAQWTDRHWAQIHNSADRPFEEKFWLNAEHPFQALACCFELSAAMRTTNNQPHLYECSLPVHQGELISHCELMKLILMIVLLLIRWIVQWTSTLCWPWKR